MHKLRTVYVEISSRCNLSCTYCYRSMNEYSSKNRLMDMDLYTHILEGIRALGDRPRLFMHAFGEPTLHPLLNEMVAMAKNSEAVSHIAFVSNMMVRDAEAYRSFFTSGLDTLYFSLDTLHEKQLKRTRRGTDISRILSVVTELARDHADKMHPITVFSCANLDNMHELGSLFSSLGIRNWNVQLHFTHDGGFGVGIEETTRVKADMVGAFPNMRINFEEAHHFHCTQPFDTLVANALGKVTPCCQSTNHDLICLGDLTHEDVRACLTSEAFIAFRREFAQHRPPFCADCPFYGTLPEAQPA